MFKVIGVIYLCILKQFICISDQLYAKISPLGYFLLSRYLHDHSEMKFNVNDLFHFTFLIAILENKKTLKHLNKFEHNQTIMQVVNAIIHLP